MSLAGVKADFPIFSHLADLVYLDSAASTHKPREVIDAVRRFEERAYANVHRGAYRLSGEATDLYEASRTAVAGFIGAADPAEVSFARGATSALNAIAHSWGTAVLGPGRTIVLTVMEHHANLIPWQQVARRTGASLRFVGIDRDFQVDLAALRESVDTSTEIVAVTGMSNVLGSMPPLSVVAHIAHEVGAVVVVDGAQLVPHAPVDVSSLDVDFMAFSAHKMLGPTGVGVMWGKRTLLERMEPFETGGEMIREVHLDGATWAPIPAKFEAGTPPVAQAIGLGAAVGYLERIGMEEVRHHDMELTSYTLDRLSELPGLQVYGPRNVERRGSAISFTMGDIHPHDVATILDSEGIAVRAGHHCAKPLLQELGIPATARASFSVYNDRSDADALIRGLERAIDIFGLS